VVVIGECQSKSVIQFAQKIGAREIAGEWGPMGGRIFRAPLSAAQEAESVAFNRKWIRDRIAEGCTFLDLGRDPARVAEGVPISPWYKAELEELENARAMRYPTKPKGAAPGVFVRPDGSPI
jgi:hypothetical protein